jgi:cytidylate kinase
MSDHIPLITIDGPGGAGKGTLGRLLARDLNFHFLDSGALYRLLVVAAERHGISLDQESSLCVLGEHMDVQFLLDDPYLPPRVIFEGEDVSEKIRLETTGNMASRLAVLPAIRESLLARQRSFLQPPGLVADGRDMGTVVFPEADLKIYLTASAYERAQRRFKELQDKQMDVKLSHLLEEIQARDARDANRSVAPLRPADDAVIIDTTALDINQALAVIKKMVPTALMGR